jgi:threonine aldolase
LNDDHTNARLFAEAIITSDAIEVDLAAVQTNLVYFETADADRLADACLTAGVSMLALGPTTIRAVFHLDVSTEDAQAAAATVAELADSFLISGA